MDRLSNVIQHYAWGSKELLAGLCGRPPAEVPEAELWMGAHPLAPSRVGGRSLPELIAENPFGILGRPAVQRHGPRLPYLLKLLAAAQPLSLQAHPSLTQAREGFERENQQGIPLTSAERSYKDPNHKPELLCALSPFRALCGFRAAADSAALLGSLGQAELGARFRAGPREAFEWLMLLPKAAASALVDAVVAACRQPSPAWQAERATALELSGLYPGDVGVVVALLLNHLELKPGQAIYLPAGNLHAYLGGLAVEVMASSDNVLRGGLTPKHVDVRELLKVLDFHTGPVSILNPTRREEEEVYLTPAQEFRLSRFTLEGRSLQPSRGGVEILLCTAGRVCAGSLELRPGESVLVPAHEGLYGLSGQGVVYRVVPNG